MRLNKRNVESIALAGREQFIWDDDLPGFGVRVYPSGRRVYLVQYRARGRTRRYVLGIHGPLTAAEARKSARTTLGDVARGEDPAATRAQERRASSVAELCDAYLELHSRPRKRSAGDDEQRVRDFLKPAWGSRKAVDILRPDVIALHRRIGSERGRYTANRLLATVSSMWNWAEREGLLPLGHPNPARGISRFPEESRDRWLTPTEVRRVFDAVKQEGNPHVRAFFALALLTGARKRELLTLRWDSVHDHLIRIGQTKNGQPHLLPLSDPAQAILAALPRVDGNPFVFPSPLRRGESLSVPVVDQAWRRIRISAQLGDARVHDLRRTLGSWIAQGGVSLLLIGRTLNHRSQAATAVYARLALDDVRRVLDGHAEALRHAGLNPSQLLGGTRARAMPLGEACASSAAVGLPPAAPRAVRAEGVRAPYSIYWT